MKTSPDLKPVWKGPVGEPTKLDLPTMEEGSTGGTWIHDRLDIGGTNSSDSWGFPGFCVPRIGLDTRFLVVHHISAPIYSTSLLPSALFIYL